MNDSFCFVHQIKFIFPKDFFKYGPGELQFVLTSHSHHTMRIFLGLVLHLVYEVIVAFGFGLHESYDLFTHKLKRQQGIQTQ